jgi:hypothetical protein
MTERIAKLQAQVVSLYSDENKSIREISELLGINLKTVRRVLKTNHVSVKGSKKNLLGNRYGRLEVVKYIGNDNSQKAMWECWCKCGNKTNARASDLTSGKIKSCGCYRLETSRENVLKAHMKYPKSYGFKGIGDIPGGYLSRMKHRAFIRQLEYSISKEYLWDLFLTQDKKCAMTGLDIGFGKWKDGLQGKSTASLDRIDSTEGYVEGNVQWVHKDINNIKQDYTVSKFLNYCKLVIDYEKNKHS